MSADLTPDERDEVWLCSCDHGTVIHSPLGCEEHNCYCDLSNAQAHYAAVERIFAARAQAAPLTAEAIAGLLAEHKSHRPHGGYRRCTCGEVFRVDGITMHHHDERHRAHQAEVIALAQATASQALERVRAMADKWAVMAGQAMDPDTREWLTAASSSVRAALGGDPDHSHGRQG